MSKLIALVIALTAAGLAGFDLYACFLGKLTSDAATGFGFLALILFAIAGFIGMD